MPSRRIKKKRSSKSGLPPGTLVHIGERVSDEVKVHLIDYSPETLEERDIEDVSSCKRYRDSGTVTWIDVDGLHNVDFLRELGHCFGLHPLAMEDILNTNQRAKFEDYGEFLFVVLRMLRWDDADKEVKNEQVSLVLGKGFVLSFQEREGDVFNPVRDRIRNHKGRIGELGADYLAYALMDAVVDNYFAVVEKLSDGIEALEEEITRDPTPDDLRWLHRLKRETIMLRKSVWPLREMLSLLERAGSDLIQEQTRYFLRDIYDHSIQVMETVDSYRDLLTGMLDIYLSTVSNRMNQVMKVLTIIATIFIPLTFIVGVYGMNFEYMPEIGWRYGYFAVLGFMLALSLFMLYLFRRKDWL